VSIKRIGPTKPIPTLERANELYFYEPSTGNLRRKQSRGNQKAGAIAGNRCGDHIQVMMDNELYGAHQIIWLIVTGVWPLHEIDHRDLNGRNNKWGNLREANHSQNMANRAAFSNHATGHKGVSIKKGNRSRPYVARISPNGTMIHLGCFATLEEASEAYTKAAIKHFGDFAR
jgi:hypothetical protein